MTQIVKIVLQYKKHRVITERELILQSHSINTVYYWTKDRLSYQHVRIEYLRSNLYNMYTYDQLIFDKRAKSMK